MPTASARSPISNTRRPTAWRWDCWPAAGYNQTASGAAAAWATGPAGAAPDHPFGAMHRAAHRLARGAADAAHGPLRPPGRRPPRAWAPARSHRIWRCFRKRGSGCPTGGSCACASMRETPCRARSGSPARASTAPHRGFAAARGRGGRCAWTWRLNTVSRAIGWRWPTLCITRAATRASPASTSSAGGLPVDVLMNSGTSRLVGHCAGGRASLEVEPRRDRGSAVHHSGPQYQRHHHAGDRHQLCALTAFGRNAYSPASAFMVPTLPR